MVVPQETGGIESGGSASWRLRTAHARGQSVILRSSPVLVWQRSIPATRALLTLTTPFTKVKIGSEEGDFFWGS
jgi:hypothetical protein